MVGTTAQRHPPHHHWVARLRQPIDLGDLRRHLHPHRRHHHALVRIQRSAGRTKSLAAADPRYPWAVVGLIILWNPELGGVTLTFVIAAWAVVGGILTIISALRVRQEIDNEWWLVISGILAIIFGILVFTNILAGILTIAWVFGVFAIVVGILSIVLAFRVRDFGTQIGAVT